MIAELLKISNLNEVGELFLKNWETNEIDSLSEKDLNNFKKILLSKNELTLGKKLSPLENFAYNRFNITRAVISSLNNNLIKEKLRFALWHRIIKHKTIFFMGKVQNQEETQEKLSYLLKSLDSLQNYQEVSTKEELAKYFLIISDLTGQLGFQMFSIMSAKNSLKNDPELNDASILLGKSYLEFSSAFSRKIKSGTIQDNNASSIEYNLKKSKELFKHSLTKASPKLKNELNSLLASIQTVIQEIADQRQKGQNTIVQVTIENYIQNKMEEIEEQIINYYNDTHLQFPTNIKTKETKTNKEDDIANIFKDKMLNNEETLTILDTPKPIKSKSGKLFDIYNNANKPINNKPKAEQKSTKQGTITSDKIGYKLSLQDLQEIIKKKNEELNDLKR